MVELKGIFEQLQFDQVKTYVQSGNVVFRHNTMENSRLEAIISQQIKTKLGFEIPAIVLSETKLERILLANPFRSDSNSDSQSMYVTFLSEKPQPFSPEVFLPKLAEGEDIAFSDEAVYFYCPNGYGKTKLSNNFIESKLKVTATTRNWKTTNELLRIAEATV